MKKGKLCMIVLMCLLLAGCYSCATTLRNFSLVENPSQVYAMPSSVPDFSRWDQGEKLIHVGQNFMVTLNGFANPKNDDEWVFALMGKEKDGDRWNSRIISVTYVPSAKKLKQDNSLFSMYADERYLKEGAPSLVLMRVDEVKKADVERLITQKELSGDKL